MVVHSKACRGLLGFKYKVESTKWRDDRVQGFRHFRKQLRSAGVRALSTAFRGLGVSLVVLRLILGVFKSV